MKIKILIIAIFFIISSILVANNNSNPEISKTKSSFCPHISLTCGIQYGLPSSRINLKYYNSKIIYALRYTDYDTFFIGTKPYREGIIMSHEELSFTINRIFYSPDTNIHCSLGSGLLYGMKTVRDERISYENWTEKEIQDIGLPIELNLETFFKPTHFVLNFGYKAIIYQEKFYQGAIIDIGFWFGKKYNK
ncbi:MAG: hypothetical protein DRH89_07350 [Candidatus Cloacimonadota bacterium]|nr:MAG: hypothetical protein DRH89_07350 [Candidatus Cloacimonadota bacterium]